jgi:hypothetical protein
VRRSEATHQRQHGLLLGSAPKSAVVVRIARATRCRAVGPHCALLRVHGGGKAWPGRATAALPDVGVAGFGAGGRSLHRRDEAGEHPVTELRDGTGHVGDSSMQRLRDGFTRAGNRRPPRRSNDDRTSTSSLTKVRQVADRDECTRGWDGGGGLVVDGPLPGRDFVRQRIHVSRSPGGTPSRELRCPGGSRPRRPEAVPRRPTGLTDR